MSAEDHLRVLLDGLLRSKEVKQIDFYVGSIHVDDGGFARVQYALFSGAIGVAIGGVPAGAGAAYGYDDDTFHFKSANFGSTVLDQMYMVHESVHALNDIRGAWASSPTGGQWTTFTQDEASAYIAGMLFMRYATGAPADPNWLANNPPQYAEADTIAGTIMNAKGAVVQESDVMSLRKTIASRPVYQQNGIKLWTRAGANGLH